MKTNLKLKNIVTVKLIDKETGKVLREYRSENDVLDVGATCLLNFIRGATANGNWNTVNLFTSAGAYIKSITGSFGSISDGAGYKYVVLTATDSSTDEYTFRILGLYHAVSNDRYTQNLYNVQASDITKGSTQILQVTWEIRIAYVTA